MNETSLNKKIINNAVSAYFLIFISLGFLINKQNNYINNDFVKGHTKTAFFIHSLFLFVYIIFIRLIKEYYVNKYVASILFLGVLGLLLYGVYKANKGEEYKIIDIVKMSKAEKVADLHKTIENDEQSKFSFFLSYLPFLSYANFNLLGGHTKYNGVYKNNIYTNLVISFIISLTYIAGKTDLAIFILLFYIILIVFVTIILIVQNNLIYIYINHIEKIEHIELYIKTYLEYFKNYTKNKFTPIRDLTLTNYNKELSTHNQNEAYLNGLKDSRLTNKLIYIPIINFIYLFSLDTKYRFHIINGLSLTIIAITIILINLGLDSTLFLLLYPVCFGIGHLKGPLAYKQTFTFHIFNSLILIANKFSSIKKKVKETKNTVKKTDFKIEGEIEAGGKKIIEEVKEGSIVEKKEEVKVEEQKK